MNNDVYKISYIHVNMYVIEVFTCKAFIGKIPTYKVWLTCKDLLIHLSDFFRIGLYTSIPFLSEMTIYQECLFVQLSLFSGVPLLCIYLPLLYFN